MAMTKQELAQLERDARNAETRVKNQKSSIERAGGKPGVPGYSEALITLRRLGEEAIAVRLLFTNAQKVFDTQEKKAKNRTKVEKAQLEAAVKGEVYVPTPTKQEVAASSQPRTPIEDYIKVVAGSSKDEIKNLQKLLKNAGKNYLGVPYYVGPVDGIFGSSLGPSLARLENEMQGLDLQTGKIQNREDYFRQIAQQGLAQPPDEVASSGTKLPVDSGQRIVFTPIQAKSLINTVSNAELGRDATPDELKKYTSDLKKAQSQSITTTKYSMVNGVRVADRTGGLDETQFLTDIIQKNPEFAKRKQGKEQVAKQGLIQTAVANGLDLDRTFSSQLPTWLNRIKNGEDPDIFKNLIRQTAKIGLPDKVNKLLDQGLDLDTVYAPYRNTMASILEINPDSISLSDSLLRSAIQSDKEMSIYDFQREVKKDNRWQYTNNAKRDVADVGSKILKDFGLQG